MYEYKVVTASDSRFSGRFDVEAIEHVLNSYAEERWRVMEGFSAASLWKTSKTEIFFVLEREKHDDGRNDVNR